MRQQQVLQKEEEEEPQTAHKTIGLVAAAS